MSDTLAIPLLSDLRTQAMAAFDAQLQTTADQLRRRNIQVAAQVFAGLIWGEYAYLQAMVQQLFASTCTGPYLDRRANELGLIRGGPAPAAGNVIFAGTSGIPIAAGTELQDGGQDTTYATQTAVTLASGAATAGVVAITPGAAGNASPGAPLSLATAIAGVQATAFADSNGLTGGADAETDASLRARVLARLQNPPQVGASSDFYQVIRRVPGVTRAWIYPLQYGNGTVGLTFAMDGRSNPVPLAADVAAVQAAVTSYINTITATVWAPTADPIAVNVHNLAISPNATLATVQANILAALQDLFSTQGTPGGATWGDSGLVIGPGAMSNGGMLALEAISAAIAESVGVVSFDLTAPTADIAAGSAVIPTLGAVTYT
jgi:uncharacterized phage protein gp47/JayE